MKLVRCCMNDFGVDNFSFFHIYTATQSKYFQNENLKKKKRTHRLTSDFNFHSKELVINFGVA